MNKIGKSVRELAKPGSPQRKPIGILLICIGFLALVTPLTPGSWLIFIGLEFLGMRLAIWDRIKSIFIRNK